MKTLTLSKLRPTDSIIVLTGAGVSKESGLDTFRDVDGVWAKVRLEDVATPEGFERDPHQVHAFYNARRRALATDEVQPNAAHNALARLERDWKGNVLLVTQNIDDLHERAGTRNLIHMHGELLKSRCLHCRVVAEIHEDLSTSSVCSACGRAQGMRPHVVWFGEIPLSMGKILQKLARCDLFISIGTSGNVYPAAGFVAEARAHGAQAVELNLEPSLGANHFNQSIHGPATEIVPAFIEQLLSIS
ncbi:protein-lysine deacetylase/desuccinylase/lipoamidase [Azospirillaceae bacterium]